MPPAGDEAIAVLGDRSSHPRGAHGRVAGRLAGRSVSQWYLDTSAALKLMVEESESAALAERMDSEAPDLVSCLLLETELRRAAQRREVLSQERVSQFLERVGLYEVPASLFREAGLFVGHNVRSLDALHLAAAVRLGVDAVVTHDQRMAEASRELGLSVVAPPRD